MAQKVIDLSEFDPFHPNNSPSLFPPSRSHSPLTPVASSSSTNNPTPLPSQAISHDPLDTFETLSLATSQSSSNGNGATHPGVAGLGVGLSASTNSTLRHQQRQDQVLADLARDPWSSTPTPSDHNVLSEEPGQLIKDAASLPIVPTRRQQLRTSSSQRRSSSSSSSSFSPPRRLSGLMMPQLSTSSTGSAASGPGGTSLSHPTLDPFHPSSPPARHSAEWEVRRTASHSNIPFHPSSSSPRSHSHIFIPSSTSASASALDDEFGSPKSPQDFWGDFQDGPASPPSAPPTSSSLSTSAPTKRAVKPAKKAVSAPNTVKGGSSGWKKEWDYDANGQDAVHPIKLDGVRAGVRKVLDEDLAEGIRPDLPPRSRLSTKWKLIYSLDQHGISIETLYERMSTTKKVNNGDAGGGIVVVVEDENGGVFGAYLNEYMKESKTYYGDGTCFLWKSSPFASSDFRIGSSLKTFKWTGRNDYLILSDTTSISIGGGDGRFGLWIDSKFEKGYTSKCPCFNNQPLTKEWEEGSNGKEEMKFEVVRFECWLVD